MRVIPCHDPQRYNGRFVVFHEGFLTSPVGSAAAMARLWPGYPSFAFPDSGDTATAQAAVCEWCCARRSATQSSAPPQLDTLGSAAYRPSVIPSRSIATDSPSASSVPLLVIDSVAEALPIVICKPVSKGPSAIDSHASCVFRHRQPCLLCLSCHRTRRPPPQAPSGGTMDSLHSTSCRPRSWCTSPRDSCCIRAHFSHIVPFNPKRHSACDCGLHPHRWRHRLPFTPHPQSQHTWNTGYRRYSTRHRAAECS